VTLVLRARALLLEAGAWIDDGGVELAHGRVVRILRGARAVARVRAGGARVQDLGEVVLTPGLVDAHAHLDLTPLAGRVGTRGGFAGWVGELLARRAELGRRDLEQGVRGGAAELLASGTTSIGDIDSSGTSARLAGTLPLRVVVHRELLDGFDPARTPAALALLAKFSVRGGLALPGLSPHAPFTVSAPLLEAAVARARRKAWPLSIHWAETRAEVEWLARGTGPLAERLPGSPRASGLSLLARAGALGRRTSLVHGNHPSPGDPARLARAGVTLVHCPGTHRFFAREPFPLERYRRAGVRLALGTDSRASNAHLDLRREMALARAAFPRLAPGEVFEWATRGGARALGRERELGRLRPGACADLVAWDLAARSSATALEELTAGIAPVVRVYVSGVERHRAG